MISLDAESLVFTSARRLISVITRSVITRATSDSTSLKLQTVSSVHRKMQKLCAIVPSTLGVPGVRLVQCRHVYKIPILLIGLISF